MTIDKLREAVSARPFIPFTILVADGRRYRVSTPELISLAPRAERVFVVAHGDEDYTILDLLLVTGLEFARKPGTGAGRRKKAG
jgi:hypothetical protein